MGNFKKYIIRELSPEPLYIIDISWNHEGLKVTLENKSDLRKICLLFDETVYLYQDTSEVYKPSWHIGSESDYYPFYYSKKSDLIDKLKKDVDHVRDDEIIHFVIIGLDDIVDVLTTDLPKVFKL
ncbi:hypothetical protein HMPREF0072_0238 [Anaerococcus lactolyticus ATCC 51172]|uniref:Uncharacterized protein n=1 Tax=Anaerococcus lactolyticus ATCC 51172 TaxID=525254 RepID=C2BD18_9FIRM|nr:hypothetical protein [Anaerococcus lactolyticus]EEI87210.1 hypothetical protein HMPREF0072_0238 [Anaerococcus lactolyticus ATCC 51172]